ncbi:substrate-binding periplasmic protein [Halomonas sp. C05BenzN]|uniref:substrate-binding periplasmic protein n=1 Tax=Halomonas sp. C05BenzN TaxID=3411041 RepID=UPI003B95058C
MKRWLLLAVSVLLPLPAPASLDGLTFITEEYPPYNFMRHGRLEGLSVEILERIFAETDTPLTREDIHHYPWARGYETALTEPDTVLFSTTRTSQREALFQWVGPIATDRVSLIARQDSGIRLDDIGDLIDSDYRIAIIREDIGAQRLLEAGVPAARLRPAMTNVSAMMMLDRGRVDLWAYGEDVAYWLMEENGLDITDFTSVLVLSESDLYYALHRDTDPRLVARMQSALEALRRRGALRELLGDSLTFNTEEYPPFNFLDDRGEVAGTATRLLRAALEQAGLSATFRLLPWARSYTEARLRENHCVYSTTRTQEREPHFRWVGPLGTNQWAAFTLAGNPLEASSLDDLAAFRVGSFREDAVGQFVEQQGVSVVVAPTERENIGRLQAGLIDAWVTGRQTARLLAEDAGIELRELFGFQQVELYLACHPSVPERFVTRLQAALDRPGGRGRPEPGAHAPPDERKPAP